MAWQPTLPLDNSKLKLTPAWLRDNWAAIEAGAVWSGVSTAKFLLKSAGAGAPPVWGLPENLQIASQAQGTILYYSGSAWVVLAVGTNGNILKTQGAGANPAWTDTAPKANELSIASQAQGDIAYFNGTNWVRLAAGTAGYYLKTQGVAANPIWAALGAATDLSLTGQEQGDVVYFNGSNWVVLHHGTAGQVLKTGGHGANPVWDVNIGSSVAGSYIIASAITERSESGNSPVKVKEIYMPRDGILTVVFDGKSVSTNGDGFAQIYKNGSPVGTLRSMPIAYTTYSENISGWVVGDLCQLYIYGYTGTGTSAYIKNFYIKENVPIIPVVILD